MAEHARTEGGNTRYYSVIGGDFVRKVAEGTEGAIARTNKNSIVVHEIHVAELDGSIIDMRTREDQRGALEICITLSDDKGKYIIQLPLKSGVAKCFISILPHLDLGKPVRISVKRETKGDKHKDSLFVQQQTTGTKWEALKWAFTKANPNGCPPMVEREGLGGKKEWDDLDQLKFFLNVFNEYAAKVTPPVASSTPAPSATAASFAPATSEAPTDDLPF